MGKALSLVLLVLSVYNLMMTSDLQLGPMKS